MQSLQKMDKPLCFSIRGLDKPRRGTKYETVFPQHDVVGYLLLGEMAGQLRKKQGLPSKEIEYIREITRYHVAVHDALYLVADKVARGLIRSDKESCGRVHRVLRRKKLRPEIIIDSLLLIKAGGKDTYHPSETKYRDYRRATDILLRCCMNRLETTGYLTGQ